MVAHATSGNTLKNKWCWVVFRGDTWELSESGGDLYTIPFAESCQNHSKAQSRVMSKSFKSAELRSQFCAFGDVLGLYIF